MMKMRIVSPEHRRDHTFTATSNKALVRPAKGTPYNELSLYLALIPLNHFPSVNLHQPDFVRDHRDKHVSTVPAYADRRQFDIVKQPLANLFPGLEVIYEDSSLKKNNKS